MSAMFVHSCNIILFSDSPNTGLLYSMSRHTLAFSLFLSTVGLGLGLHWEYLTFTQTWPMSFCNFTHCKKIPHPMDFTIHGLWPNPYIEASKCNPAPEFDAKSLEPIKSELSKYWPNFASPGSPSFWKYEYDKHGKCALEDSLLSTELKYFNTSLVLRRKLDLKNKLATKGITPSNTTIYERDDFLGALKEALKVSVKITCLKAKKQMAFIDEVRVCFNPALEMIDCYDYEYGVENRVSTIHCPETFMFPSSPH
ncbi:unnamed protein product [Calicophoron daubneyi]|uniref:Uncharacterized protein n=1 Tax=Calicophoron daubneyi TaxID=300641 RepID=A0AAV2T729_CALDB